MADEADSVPDDAEGVAAPQPLRRSAPPSASSTPRLLDSALKLAPLLRNAARLGVAVTPASPVSHGSVGTSMGARLAGLSGDACDSNTRPDSHLGARTEPQCGHPIWEASMPRPRTCATGDHLTVRLDPTLYGAIADRAERLGEGRGAVVRALLRAALAALAAEAAQE